MLGKEIQGSNLKGRLLMHIDETEEGKLTPSE